MNLFRFFGLKRKLVISLRFESFFELHSSVTEGKKDEKWV
jgi:hypothetical protein